MTTKVAVVTGGNKGIGFAIVKGLCEKFPGDVYLTARNISKGQAAVKELNKLGFHPIFHFLDVTISESVIHLRDTLKEKYGGIDVLINNAGIAFPNTSPVNLVEQAEHTISVNYFALVSTCNILFPILKAKARVVNLSSSLGHLSQISDANLRARFGNTSLTEAGLSDLVREFVDSVRDGTYKEKGWRERPYIVSKVAVSALTFIQNREYGPKDISINCVHPGYVSTDMTLHMGPLTVEEGAVSSLYLALDAPESLKGVYMWRDKTVVDWYGVTPDVY